MSGDVQPRKRKDKRKKKDDLGVEEPRGTAAALGDGDVFMHSYSDHGTGGHWCAKIIFFSLLAILVTLIGLIILENRGLSELEANSVESRYSGVLEGWLEDVPDDDHHDAHTLELNHPDEEHDDHEDHEEDEEPEEVEKLEEEFPDEEPISTELPALPEDNDDEDDKQLEESVEEDEIDNEPNDADDDDEFLSPDDEDLPIIEHITAPAGKPYVEVDEDDTSTELPPDTLKDEEEYERQQEELRREEEEAAAASQKDGGNSIGDAWPGEPSEAYWRQELDDSEEDVQQDWLE